MCHARRLPRRRNAFTLIELLVVMALILVIFALGIGYVVFGQDNQHSVKRRPGRDRRAAQRQAARPPRRPADRHSHPVRHERPPATQASQLQLIQQPEDYNAGRVPGQSPTLPPPNMHPYEVP